jgi:ribosomal protein S18 acetylase RimI-like enzyme
VTVVDEIEDALVIQWSHFGRWPRGRLYENDELVRFETPIRHLPYNGVIRTRLANSSSTDRRIADVLDSYRECDVQLFWLDHPSATPRDLGVRLEGQGLQPVETMHCMSLELDRWIPIPAPADIAVDEVRDDAALEVYTDLTLRYWEIPDEDGQLVAEVHRYWGPARAPGARFLARLGGEAVGKAYVLPNRPRGVASIYGMSVVPEARGRGVARLLTETLLTRARRSGCRRVVLHSTDRAHSLYRKVGFEDRCEIAVFATAQFWSDEH